MNRTPRVWLFAAGALGLAAALLAAMHGLPGFGDYPGPYGDVINAVAVAERHTTDAVTSVNFDYRAVDTLGEEFILFVAATGVSVVLRRLRERREEPMRSGVDAVGDPGDTVRGVALASIGPLLILGIYLVTHGQVSPGGGFQGGVVVASAFIALYLAGRYLTLRRVNPVPATEAVEAAGAAGFVVIGVAAMLAGGAFLTNVLPLGTPATIDSAGSIALISFTVGVEVVGGFVIVVSEFLDQTLLRSG